MFCFSCLGLCFACGLLALPSLFIRSLYQFIIPSRINEGGSGFNSLQPNTFPMGKAVGSDSSQPKILPTGKVLGSNLSKKQKHVYGQVDGLWGKGSKHHYSQYKIKYHEYEKTQEGGTLRMIQPKVSILKSSKRGPCEQFSPKYPFFKTSEGGPCEQFSPRYPFL